MAAVRFFSEFTSDKDIDYKIEIWDKEFAGDPTEFTVADDGYTLSYAQDGTDEKLPRFMATRCSIAMMVENNTHFELITDFFDAPEGRFMVRILKGVELEWVGTILSDSTTYEEWPYPFNFNIVATDGLGALKSIPFKTAADAFYTGKATYIEYIARALSRIAHIDTFYDIGDALVLSMVDWWEESMVRDAEGEDMLSQAYLTNAVYYTYIDGVQGVLSCWDVLDDILKSLKSRITYSHGAFWIEQDSYRRSAVVVQRRWGKDAAFLGAVNFNTTNPITQNTSRALKSTAEYDGDAPISRARYKFKALERRNFFAGAENVDNNHTGIDTFNVPIHANAGATTLRITGGLMLRIKSNNPVPGYLAPLDPFVAVIRLNIFLDSVGIQRLYTLQPSYQVVYSAATWNATPGCYVVQAFHGPFLGNVNGDFFPFAQSIDIMTPPLPENTESFTFSCELEALKKFDGTAVSFADFEIEYEISNLWLEAYSGGGPVLSGDGVLYYTDNTETSNTLVWEAEGLTGSSTNPNTVGAIWVRPGSDFELAGAWAVGSGSYDYDFLGQLLTLQMVATHARPARRLNGTLYGNIIDLGRVVWQDADWLLQGGNWMASKNEFQGQWLEMKTVDGFTPSAPIKFVATVDPNPPGTNTDIPGAPGSFRAGAPLGSGWYAVAAALTDENLRAGTPGTISIQQTLAQYDLNVGDMLAIFNPFTGEFEELEVSTGSANGDTFVVTTGDLVGNYPVGSPMVRIPRIGGPYQLPSGANGQILRHNGTRWLPYGTTALSDGVVLTWTDAGGWAAAALPAGYTDEQAQDAVGNALTDSTEIDFTYDDTAGTITAVLKTTGVSGGTYNSVTVDTKGRITAASVVAYLTGNQAIALSGDVTGSGTTSIATTIANNAVTLAKMAQVATARFLGRVTALTGNVEALTGTQATTLLDVFTSALKGLVPASGGGTVNFLRADGTWAPPATGVTGSGVAGQVSVWSGSGAITGFVSLLYDNANGRLQINTTGTPVAPSASLEVRHGTLSGSFPAMDLRASVSNDWTATVRNQRAAAGGANAIIIAEVAATSSGDAFYRAVVVGGKTWSWGVDNSDLDKFKLRPEVDLGTGATGGEGLTITADVTPLVGINTDTPAHPLDVNGIARALTWTSRTDATAPTWTFGTGAGGSPSMTSLVYPNGNMGTVRFSTGTSPSAGQRIINLVPPTAVRHANKIYVVLQALNDVTARDISKFVVDPSATTPGNIALKSNGLLSGLDASTEYYLTFIVMGHA